MKRDMDLIRQLLFDLEAEEPSGYKNFDFKRYAGQYDLRLVAYHLELLTQAGLISARDRKTLHSGEELWWGVRVSWLGHEFLNEVRSDTVWNAVKQKLSSTVGTVSFQVLGELARQVARQMVGL